MGNDYQPDFEGAVEYARRHLHDGLDPVLTYHSLEHTQSDIIPAVQRLATLEGITGETLMLLLTAAWFHDVGFIHQRDNHEEMSVQICYNALPTFGYTAEQIGVIAGIIRATKLPQTPYTLLEQIMADADLDSLGREDFFVISDGLRAEMAYFGQAYSDIDWYRFELNFLQSHTYFTRAARQLRNLGKQRNIEMLRQHLRDLENAT